MEVVVKTARHRVLENEPHPHDVERLAVLAGHRRLLGVRGVCAPEIIEIGALGVILLYKDVNIGLTLDDRRDFVALKRAPAARVPTDG